MKVIQLAMLAAYLGSCTQPGVKPHYTGLEGKPMPAFDLLLTDSTWINSINFPEGKTTVLFYFNPNCPYCKVQTKDMMDKMDQFSDVQFVMVTDYPFEEMNEYAELFRFAKYPNIITGYDTAHFVRDYYRAAFVPFTAIFSSKKQLEKAYMGQIYSLELLDAIKEHRKKPIAGS